MMKTIGRAGLTCHNLGRIKMQQGIKTPSTQKQIHKLGQASDEGPIIQPHGKKRFVPGQVQYNFGIIVLSLCLSLLLALQQMKREEHRQDILDQLINSIFIKDQFNPRAFLPLCADLSRDITYFLPSCTLFALYNLFVKQQNMETAINCVKKVQNTQPNSAANVAALVIRSASEAYSKKYKESLQSLKQAYEIAVSPELDRKHSQFYHKVVVKMIEIHDLSTFRREYLEFIDNLLEKFGEKYPHLEFVRALEARSAQIKQKVCLTKHQPRLKNTGSGSRLTINKPDRIYQNLGTSRQKSVYSRDNSLHSLVSGKSRYKFKKHEYVNPYDFITVKNDHCAFM